MIKCFPIQPHHVRVSAFMVCMTAFAGLAFNDLALTMIALTLFYICRYLFMTIQTQRALIRLKRFMAG